MKRMTLFTLLSFCAVSAKAQVLKIDVSSESISMIQMVAGAPAEQVLTVLWQQASARAADQILRSVIEQQKPAAPIPPAAPAKPAKKKRVK